ncbi:hypothetical protein ACFL49_01245 [Candidatus Omnitrophota bacterium]
MKTTISLILIVLFMPSMTGCTAVGVPYTSNPDKKLRYAESLFNNEDRPLPAQDLIMEAIDKYKTNEDDDGLANAYRTYAFFLQSPTVGRWSKMSFEDKTVTHENRFRKSAEYWEKAIRLYDRNDMYNLSADCYFQLEKLYYVAFKDISQVCYYNDMSRRSIEKFRQNNPNAKLNAMGYSSFEKMLETAREQLGCE